MRSALDSRDQRAVAEVMERTGNREVDRVSPGVFISPGKFHRCSVFIAPHFMYHSAPSHGLAKRKVARCTLRRFSDRAFAGKK